MGIRFILSLAYAEIALLLILSQIPGTPNPPTAVIGFPLYANFPASCLSHWYYAHAVALPILTITLQWLLSLRGPKVETSRPLDFELRPVPIWILRALVGLTLSLALGSILDRVSPLFLLGGTLLYSCSLYIISRAPQRLDDLVQRIAIPLCCFVPWLVSQRTTVQIQNQTAQSIPWFPLGLSAAAWAIAVGALLTWRKQTKSIRWERSAILWGVVPILLFLFHSQLPDPRWFIHLYHDGESLVTGRLLKEGLFPWRDFVFFHGLLLDPFMGWFGTTWLQNSLWGVDAGVSLILKPLSACLVWLGLLRMVPKHPMLLLAIVFLGPLLEPTLADTYNFRFVLLPLFWLAVQEVLQRRSKGLSRALGLALAIQFVLAPETLFYLVAVVITLGLFEWKRSEDRFLRTIGVLVGGLVSAAAVSFWLWSHQALGAFVQFHLNLASQYMYATAIPIKWEMGGWFRVAVLTPLLCHVTFTALFWKRWRRGILTPNDWAMFSINLFSILYFRKFIYRADEHILAHHALAAPVLLWLVAEAVASFRWRHPIGTYRAVLCVSLLLGLVVSAPRVYKKAAGWTDQWRRVVPATSPWTKMGFHQPDKDLSKIIVDFEGFFREFPSATVFDFTNEPLLFYYFLERKPPSRYLSSFSATSLPAQKDLIGDLERSQPRFVIYSSRLGYATLDGVPGMVRHHAISQYLLTHYRPFRDLGHHFLLERKDTGPAHQKPAAQTSYQACQWGFAPQSLDRTTFSLAPFSERELPLVFRQVDEGGDFELAPPGGDIEAYRFLELQVERAESNAFSLSDVPSANPSSTGSIGFSSEQGGRNKFLIPVGSCLQWHLFSSPKLFLSSTTKQRLISARLIP